jgi:hypothetical protein
VNPDEIFRIWGGLEPLIPSYTREEAFSEIRWSAIEGEELSAIVFLDSLQAPYMRIDANSLLEGRCYTFELFVNEDSMISSSTVDVEINRGPEGGTCEISEVAGTAYSTEFTIWANDWRDNDIPLTYRFKMEDSNGSSFPLTAEKSIFWYKLRLPEGSNIVCEVYDSFHTMSSAIATVDVDSFNQSDYDSIFQNYLIDYFSLQDVASVTNNTIVQFYSFI